MTLPDDDCPISLLPDLTLSPSQEDRRLEKWALSECTWLGMIVMNSYGTAQHCPRVDTVAIDRDNSRKT